MDNNLVRGSVEVLVASHFEVNTIGKPTDRDFKSKSIETDPQQQETALLRVLLARSLLQYLFHRREPGDKR